MSSENKKADLSYRELFQEACWSTMMIWERINHAYTSDSPPKEWGNQKGDYGFQCWSFNSHNESYTVVWDADRSYWKVETPFGLCLYFVGPVIIDKLTKGLPVPPIIAVNSDTDVLKPAREFKVAGQIRKIQNYVTKRSAQEKKT